MPVGNASGSRCNLAQEEKVAVIDINVIEDRTEFAKLEPYWNDLLQHSSEAACHSTFEWLFTWWTFFGAGRRLLLIVAYEGGVPVGFAPLFVGNGGTEPRYLHFIGQGLSDYADLITPSGRPDVVEALCSGLLDLKATWDGIDLEEIPEDSPTTAILDRALRTGGVDAVWQTTVRCPYLPIKDDWDVFYATMGKGFRHEVRNKLNRWNSSRKGKADSAALTYVDRREADDTFITEAAELSARRQSFDGHRSPFLNHPDYEFLREVLPLMGRRNQLRIGELRSEGVLIAFLLSFYWRGVVYTWNTQYEPAMAEYSLGRLVLVRFAEQAFNEACHELNFMRGDETYKFEWTTLFRTNMALRSGELAGVAQGEGAH
jgi:CelD/BcsL family acetyltransferase involved in cellulose biosynthesis